MGKKIDTADMKQRVAAAEAELSAAAQEEHMWNARMLDFLERVEKRIVHKQQQISCLEEERGHVLEAKQRLRNLLNDMRTMAKNTLVHGLPMAPDDLEQLIVRLGAITSMMHQDTEGGAGGDSAKEHDAPPVTTILAADVVGYSRLMAADETGTLTSLEAIRRELIEPKTAEHHGHVVKLIGDGTLMEFGSVVDGIRFAVDVQQAMAERNGKVPEDRRITYRIGINIGDIIVEGDDIYGDGVNIAACLEALAEPGGICVSQPVHTQTKGKVDLAFENLGKQKVKNIPDPVHVYRVLLDARAADQGTVAAVPTRRSLRWPVVAGGLALLVILAGVALWQRPWAPALRETKVAQEVVNSLRHDLGAARQEIEQLTATLKEAESTSVEYGNARAEAEAHIQQQAQDIEASNAEVARLNEELVASRQELDQVTTALMEAEAARTKVQTRTDEQEQAVETSDAEAALGFPGEAVVEAEKAVALDTNDATALAGLADALIKAGRAAEGLDYIEQALRLDPHYPPDYLIILGAAQFGMERYEEASATFERAVKRNPDNEIPFVYLASAYGRLGRVEDADDAIEQANDLRNSVGLGELSLRENSAYSDVTLDSEIDFKKFGSKPIQDHVRTGLSDIPALQWQFLVTVHRIAEYGTTRCEVLGAAEIDVQTAKTMHDQGAVFIDVSHPEKWKEQHIPGAVHLTYVRSKDLAQKKFSRRTLKAIVDETAELVIYRRDAACYSGVWEAAKAVAWGYQNVSFFLGGAQAWKEAGYPFETGK